MKYELRKWRLSDAKELAAALNNKRILNNLRDGLPFPYTEQDGRDYIIATLSANERSHESGQLLSHSNSFSFEMEKDTAGCRALNRNYIVGESDEGDHLIRPCPDVPVFSLVFLPPVPGAPGSDARRVYPQAAAFTGGAAAAGRKLPRAGRGVRFGFWQCRNLYTGVLPGIRAESQRLRERLGAHSAVHSLRR